jgi:hypothetical protein
MIKYTWGENYMSYCGVLKLASEHHYSVSSKSELYPNGIDWLKVVKGCYEEAEETARLNNGFFPGSRVADRVGLFPGLRLLVKYGILAKVGETTRHGTRAYYMMPDMAGVRKALLELGYLNKQ